MQYKPLDKHYCGVRMNIIDNAKPVLNQTVKKHLFQFIKDRTEVYYKKEICRFNAPWTQNEILQQVKFTNVRREWDRQSKLLIKNICEQTKYDLKTRCFNIILFRLWNKFDSWALLNEGKLIEFPLTEEKFKEYYEKIELEQDHTWYSAAYNSAPVRNCHRTQLDKTFESKPFYSASPLWFAKWYLNDSLWEQIKSASDQEELFKVLQQFPYMGGPFLAYQLFVDFTYNADFWFSENEFTVSGPGCSRGLDLLFEDYDGMTHEEALFWLRDNQIDIFDEFLYDPDIIFHFLPEEERKINLMSWENLHCELSKYIKCVEALEKGDKPRGKVSYNGTGLIPIKLEKITVRAKESSPKTIDLFEL